MFLQFWKTLLLQPTHQATHNQCAGFPGAHPSSARRYAHGHTGVLASAANLPPCAEPEEQRAPRLTPEVLSLFYLRTPASWVPEYQLREEVNFCSTLFLEICERNLPLLGGFSP